MNARVQSSTDDGLPERPHTLSSAKAWKGTLVVSGLGVVLLAVQNRVGPELPQWTQNLMVLLFVIIFAPSGYDFDWRGRVRLLCSTATILAILGIFSQISGGVTIDGIGQWTLILLGVNVASWFTFDALQNRHRKSEAEPETAFQSLGNRPDTRISSEENPARIDSRSA